MAMLHSADRKVVLSRLCRFLTTQRSKLTSDQGGTGDRAWFSSSAGELELSKWRKVDSRALGISRSMIPFASWKIIKILQAAGYEAYFVGGCVRDLVLHRIPKDFDIITTAELKQVKSKFRRAIIVGQRFPICRVYSEGSFVEVSSFSTSSQECSRDQFDSIPMPRRCDPRDINRWKNCMKRDFTVNSLFFDPSRNVIFDYMNALKDLRSLKLRTIMPAQLSFKEDEARILRGLRLAARLNFLFSKEAEEAIYSLSSSVVNLSKSRIILEMNYMFSYGAAASSILLLEKFKLLALLLPFHAAYFSEQSGNGVDLQSTMLMKLFSNMDQLISCDRPAHESLWIAIFAFHKALFSNPRHPLVVLMFASLLYHGRWVESMDFSRKNSLHTEMYVPEILKASSDISDEDIANEVSQLAREVEDSVDLLANVGYLSGTMTKFSKSLDSSLVFVSPNMAQRVRNVFSILAQDVLSLNIHRKILEFDSKSLAAGDKGETRFVLGKIILETLVAGSASGSSERENRCNVVTNSPEASDVLEQSRHKTIHPGDGEFKDSRKRRRLPSSFELSADSDRKLNQPSLKTTGGRVNHRRNVLDGTKKDESSENRNTQRLSSLFKS